MWVKTFIIGLVALIFGLYFVTDMAGDFTKAANDVFCCNSGCSRKDPLVDSRRRARLCIFSLWMGHL